MFVARPDGEKREGGEIPQHTKILSDDIKSVFSTIYFLFPLGKIFDN